MNNIQRRILFLARTHLEQEMILATGITMVIVGFFGGPDLLSGVPSGSTTATLRFMAYAVMTALGVLGLLSMLRFDNRVSTTMLVLGIVLNLLFLASSDAKSLGGDYKLIVRMMLNLLGAFCVVFAIGLMLDHRQNALRIEVILAGFMFLNLFRFVFALHHGVPFRDCVMDHYRYNVDMLLAALAFILLNMKSSRYATSMMRLKRSIQSIESTDAIPGGTYMIRRDLERILDPERSEWVESDMDGVESELAVMIYSTSMRIRLVFRKWEEDVTVSVLPADEGVQQYQHLVIPMRHTAVRSLGGGYGMFRIYGDDGMYIDILVRNTHIRKYRTMDEYMQSMKSLNPMRLMKR